MKNMNLAQTRWANWKPAFAKSVSGTHPHLVSEWHESNTLRPTDVTPGSEKVVLWQCSVLADHQWETSVDKRAKRGHGCPFCSGHRVHVSNSLATLHPNLVKEWHDDNKKTAHDVTPGSNLKVKWHCDLGHVWDATVNNRTNSSRPAGCPSCKNRRVDETNCLTATHFALSRELSETSLGSTVVAGSHEILSWQCAKGHSYSAAVYSRVSGSTCPYCSGHKVHDTTSLAAIRPRLASEWHEDNKKTANDVSLGSNDMIKWRCDFGHVWFASVHNRSNGRGCPDCADIDRTRTTSEFIDMAKIIYSEKKYEYSSVAYVNTRTKIEVLCLTHGSFWRNPQQFLLGHGCAKCRTEGVKQKSLTSAQQKRFDAIMSGVGRDLVDLV